MPDGDRLAGLPLFEGTDPRTLGRIEAACERRTATSGDVLLHQGDPGTTFLVLTSGTVEVCRAGTHGPDVLALAGPGTVLGELAMLTGRPRLATVVASSDVELLLGGPEAFALLAGSTPLHDRVAEVVARRLAEQVRPVRAVTPSGTEVTLRPLLRRDRDEFEQAVAAQSADTLRRRFFSPGAPGPAVVAHLLEINYLDHFAWAVQLPRGGEGVATGRYVRLGADPTVADLALAVADSHQGHGIGRLLVGALGAAAEAAAVHTLTAEVLTENRPMLAVLDRAGTVWDTPHMGTVTGTLTSEGAAELLDPHVRAELRTAAVDVVTAAGLALTQPPG